MEERSGAKLLRTWCVTKCVAEICQRAGFSHVEPECVSVLAEMIAKFMQKSLEILSESTEISQRTISNFFDVGFVLNKLQLRVGELRTVLDAEGSNSTTRIATSGLLTTPPQFVENVAEYRVPECLKVTESKTRKALLLQCPSFTPDFPSDHVFLHTPLGGKELKLDRQQKALTNRLAEKSVNDFLVKVKLLSGSCDLLKSLEGPDSSSTSVPLRVDFEPINFERRL